MVTFSVAKQNILFFIETFLTPYLSSSMSENKGILPTDCGIEVVDNGECVVLQGNGRVVCPHR